MLAKAKTSCLTPADVRLLQFQPYEESNELGVYPNLAGFKIPYFKLDGSVDKEFFRYRLLQTKPSKGWAAVTEDPKKPRRYTQVMGTDCGVYLPPLLGASWADVAKDDKLPIIITEGELKAACGCKLGFPTIGLGGVYNWRAAKDLQDLLPILERFKWTNGRGVTICFDSDTATNPMVRMAASRLAYTLAMRGANTLIATLPEGEDGAKQGLDDLAYALGGGEAAQEALHGILQAAEPIGPGRELHRLNNEVALVHSTAEIIELHTGNVYTPSAFSEARYRNRTYNDHPDNGGDKMIKKFAAKEWLAWPLRTEVTDLAYEPACGNMITPAGAYNTWYAQGWPLTPLDGKTKFKSGGGVVSLEPYERLFKQVFGTLSAEHQRWVKQWFAYPLQHPGAKLYTALLVWGRPQGVGKSLIGELMESIYGRNYSTVNHDQLMSQFTAWAHNVQFIVGNEISIGDKRGFANKLKEMITQKYVNINIKNRKSYNIVDCINYYFTSNKDDAIYIENSDRRYFIHHVERQTLGGKADYIAIKKWWDTEGGAQRVYYHLLHEVDTSDFEPTAPAPITAAKQEMAMAARSEIEDWCADLVRDVDSVLRPAHKPQDLWRTEDLLDVYAAAKGNSNSRAGTKAMSAALSDAGAFKVANGSNDALIYSKRTRLWALRNVDAYRRVGAIQAGKLYQAERPGTFPDAVVGGSAKFSRGKVQ
jgi:hypothetical protein